MTTLNILKDELGWPIKSISGSKNYYEPSLKRLDAAIRRLDGMRDVETFTLASGNETESSSLIAFVVKSSIEISNLISSEIHRLAWNLVKSPILVTVDPYYIRAWSLSERPQKNENDSNPSNAEIKTARIAIENIKPDIFTEVSYSLSWLNLLSGQFFEENESYFKTDNRADVVLLENLCFVRNALLKSDLPERSVNSLLARIVFIQFLFDRKDNNGFSVFSEDELANLYEKKILRSKHKSLCSILKDHEDTYTFFSLVNDKFNGDLFPGKVVGSKNHKGELSAEKKIITQDHLELLSNFVGGSLILENGQLSFWPMYSFDVIPLEFISSIYQEFLGDRRESLKAVYTPPFLADQVLDSLLPWQGDKWKLKIADFACGSGIFLVKSFQRLIARYKVSTGDTSPSPDTLVGILTKYIFGVDKDEEAVRVASFSLYLALCDEISPNILKVSNFKLPILREKNLLIGDFFSFEDNDILEEKTLSSNNTEQNKFDVIVGNAPWGEQSINSSEDAKKWAAENDVPVANGDMGPLFLFRSVNLLKVNGRVNMVQPASTFFKNSSTPSVKLRKFLFNNYSVDRITNLTLVRFSIFSKSIAPCCLISINGNKSLKKSFIHISPKPQNSPLDEFGYDIEPFDVNEVPTALAQEGDVALWASLLFGTTRDAQLINKLSKNQTLNKLEKTGDVKTRQGVIRGKSKRILKKEILNRRIVDKYTFDTNLKMQLFQSDLRMNDDGYVHFKDSTNFDAFNFPQVILSRTFSSTSLRFTAAKVEKDTSENAPICSDSFVSVTSNEQILAKSLLAYNSIISTYFLTQVDPGATYRQKPSKARLLDCPLPDQQINIDNLLSISKRKELDSMAFKAYELSEAEQVLIEDYCNYSLASLQSNTNSHANQNLILENLDTDTLIQKCQPYINRFRNNIEWLVGEELQVSSRLRLPTKKGTPPYIMMEFVLSEINSSPNGIQVISDDGKLNSLTIELMNTTLSRDSGKKVARFYDYGDNNSSIFIIKPNKKRYWTRSIAMKDADDVISDFLVNVPYMSGT